MGRVGLHPDVKSRVAFAVLDKEVQKVPLRHKGERFAVRWKMSEVRDRHRFLADLTGQFAHFLVRTLQEIFQQDQLVHQLQSRRVNRVAAKITQKVDVFLEYYDLDPERAGRKPSIIPAGPPPTQTMRFIAAHLYAYLL